MSIPIRAHLPPQMGRTAPRAIAAAASGVTGWTPSPLTRGAAGPIVVRNLPRLRVPNPAWILAGFLTEAAANELTTFLTMWLNGLEFQRFCAPRLSAGFTGGKSNCLTGQGPPTRMSQLPASVAAGPDGDYRHIMGLSGVIAGVVLRYSTSQIWRIRATPSGQTRARPFYGPVVMPAPVISWAASQARPGHVPFDVRPWPVWSTPRAVTAPSPGPEVDDRLRPPPGWGRWEWDRPGQKPDIDVRPDAPPRTRAVPNSQTQEVKIGANTPTARFFFTLMQAREKVSELDDIVDVMFDALPKNIRRRTANTDHARRVAVAEYFSEIDWQAFLRGLVANQIEDEIIGRTYFQARGIMRNAVHGNQIGSMGPVATPGFKDYAKSVSELSEQIAHRMFGDTSREREDKVRKAMWRAERERRRLTREANQQRQGQGQSRPR